MGPAQAGASPLFGAGASLDTSPGGAARVTPLVAPQGLGAPAGAVLAGRREFVGEAWRVRKLLGGGMRQAGVLAAAARVGLEHAEATLRRDHDNARRFAEGNLGPLGTPGGTGARSLMPLSLPGCAGFHALLHGWVLPCPTARHGPSLIPPCPTSWAHRTQHHPALLGVTAVRAPSLGSRAGSPAGRGCRWGPCLAGVPGRCRACPRGAHSDPGAAQGGGQRAPSFSWDLGPGLGSAAASSGNPGTGLAAYRPQASRS